jgi:hypothetical protein
MGLWGGPKQQQRVVVGLGARRGERYRATAVRCALGEIVDVSSTGMRVRGTGTPTSNVNDVLHLNVAAEKQRVNCSVRVVWRRRVGLRGYEMGLEYVNTGRGARAAIVQFARYGFVGSSNQDMDAGFEGVPADSTTESGQRTTEKPAAATKVEIENLYAILGVKPTASADEIRSAYRAIARQCHPDVATGAEATEKFTLISKAYSVLREPEMRQRYDKMLGVTRAA